MGSRPGMFLFWNAVTAAERLYVTGKIKFPNQHDAELFFTDFTRLVLAGIPQYMWANGTAQLNSEGATTFDTATTAVPDSLKGKQTNRGNTQQMEGIIEALYKRWRDDVSMIFRTVYLS